MFLARCKNGCRAEQNYCFVSYSQLGYVDVLFLCFTYAVPYFAVFFCERIQSAAYAIPFVTDTSSIDSQIYGWLAVFDLVRSLLSWFWWSRKLRVLQKLYQHIIVPPNIHRPSSFHPSICPSTYYSQLSPCGHLAITDTPLLQTGAEVPGNKNDWKLHPLLQTLSITTPNLGPDGVRYWRYNEC